MKVYYVKDNFDYQVKYYLQNLNGEYDEVVEDRVINNDVEYGTPTTYTQNVYDGYTFKKVENANTTVPANNDLVIKLYYDRNTYSYKVEHYLQKLDGSYVLDTTDRYNGVLYGSVASFDSKVYTGYTYQAGKTVNANKTVPSDDSLVIELYYDRNLCTYRVEYYYDGTLNEDKTDEFDNIKFGTTINDYVDKNITGYKFVTDENKPLEVGLNKENNVIKVYYEKDTFGYTVEYYYDGIINEENTESYTATYLDKVNTYTDKNITGYKLEKTENLPLTVSEVEDNNVIKVYYVKDKFNYTVEYYYDGILNEENTEVYTATYIDVITTYTDKVISGYKLEKEENLPLNITENEQENVIRIYYVKDNFDYKVEHYLQNLDGTYTLEEIDVYTDVLYNSEASYEVNNYVGYNYNETKTINKDSLVPANNDLVIKLYYDRNNYSYIVNHYVENIFDNEYTLMDTDTYTNAVYGSNAIYELNEYENCVYTNNEYIYNNETRTILTSEEIIANKLVPDNNNLVINVYYVRNLGKVTIHYVVKDPDNGSYIPFNVYGQDIDGNNTEDFVGLELNDLIVEGKIGSLFEAIGRNPIDYNFVGLYKGDLNENNIVSTNQEYNGSIEDELELTFVYEPPYGEGEILPPQTGVENSYASYLVYILFGVMLTLTYSYIKASKKED